MRILYFIILFLTLWTSLSKIKSEELIIDPYRLNQNYNVCKSNNMGTIFLWIIVGYKILLIIYGGYLALRIRTISIRIYDESKIIGFCIYNIGLSAIIITILQATFPTGRYVIYGINAFLVIISVSSTINTMMISKIEYLKNKSGSSGTDSSNTTQMDSMQKSTINQLQNEEYKKKLKN